MQAASSIYELFILGKLIHRPMHGYLIQSIVNAALGPNRRLSWGTLYPLLSKLERAGLIVATPEKQKDGRGTRSYRTTSEGKQRFFELMTPSGDWVDESRDLFRVRLSHFGLVGKREQKKIIADYRAFLAAVLNHSRTKAEEVENVPGLAAQERRYVLAAIEHQRYVTAAEMKWIDTLAQQLVKGSHDDKNGARTESDGSGVGRRTGNVSKRPSTGSAN